jgi:hypothetical protein
VSGRPPAVDTGRPDGEILAGVISAARGNGRPDAATALASLSAARRLAAELERGELALIEATRDGGATWSQISAALGTRNRQTAQKRHADLARRCPRPPSVDTREAPPDPGPPAPRRPVTRRPEASPPAVGNASPDAGQLPGQLQFPLTHSADPGLAAPSPPAGKPATSPGQRQPAVPQVTDEVIAGSLYELVKAPDYPETRAWLVLLGGRTAGRVRSTWHRERSRAAWEPVDLSGLPLPVRGTGRVTAAGNARTRAATAVSLLRALQQEQENAPGSTRHGSQRTSATHREAR